MNSTGVLSSKIFKYTIKQVQNALVEKLWSAYSSRYGMQCSVYVTYTIGIDSQATWDLESWIIIVVIMVIVDGVMDSDDNFVNNQAPLPYWFELKIFNTIYIEASMITSIQVKFAHTKHHHQHTFLVLRYIHWNLNDTKNFQTSGVTEVQLQAKGVLTPTRKNIKLIFFSTILGVWSLEHNATLLLLLLLSI